MHRRIRLSALKQGDTIHIMKTGRNDPCPCGSGKKYKHCCYDKDHAKHDDPVIIAAPESSEPQPDDETDEGAKSHGKRHKSPADREEERTRFRGGKGKSGSFNPRFFRGTQRGN